MVDVIILGAGVIGAFIAREIAKYDLDVLVLDKENDVGNVTSMANSAIIHSGYDPLPHTLKAKFNVLGNKMYDQVAKELDVKFIRTGSMTVATTKEHLEMLEDLKKRAHENGVEVCLLTKEEALEKEPNLNNSILGALYCPTAGIIDPFNLVVHAMENAIDNGVKLKLNEEVIDLKEIPNGIKVITKNSVYEGKIVINATGVNGDTISHLVSNHDFNIKARKGEYYVLDHFDDSFLNMPIFPLPSQKGKGILMTPTTSHNYLVGPSSEFVDDKDDLSTDSLTLSEVKKQASLIMKDIPFNMTIRTFAGNRPTPSTHDFIIKIENNHFINVVGIESPGLASAPAIGKYVVEELLSTLINIKEKENYNPNVKKYVHMKELSLEERNKLIKENHKYGHIICKCEYISEQEILDTLSRSCPPHSIKALKKRVRAGFGKCQGGMCQPNVLDILANYYHIDVLDVNYDDLNTNIIKEITKVGDDNA